MGTYTQRHTDNVDSVVTESYVYSPNSLSGKEKVNKNTYLIHLGLPTGDVVTNVIAMEFDSEEYDVVIGMDVICQGDMALTNKDGNTTFSYRVPSQEEIVFV
ncbi:MAG: hypothetical protein K6F96_00415 [Bacteroidales bacterium]|nr:hypothetical protein [Bacteroidales bacterium]